MYHLDLISDTSPDKEKKKPKIKLKELFSGVFPLKHNKTIKKNKNKKKKK
jgi:hypothetical protein